MSHLKVEEIAQFCHQVNKLWCEKNGDLSQKDWDRAEKWQRESIVAGVQFALDNPGAPVHAQHDAWCISKTKEGWRYGEKKDSELKTHPCLIPFEQLPETQQIKDKLFQAVVNALK
jgi:hypothetical protein